MNSIALPRPIVLPKRPSLRRNLVSCGVGLALSVAFYWGLFIREVPLKGPPTFPAPPNQALYEWQGFYRVAPAAHLKGLNRL
jgi:hypothetical protein